MASEIDEQGKNGKEIVEHFFSPVVEGIAFLSSLIESSQHDFAKVDHALLIKELSKESQEFIGQWHAKTEWDFLQLLNLLLPCPYFYDIDLFQEKVSNLSNGEYLYHFLDEAIPVPQIEELLGKPSLLHTIDEHILWNSEQKRHFIFDFISNVAYYRAQISKLLFEVTHSKVFGQEINKRKELLDKAIVDLKSIALEPLALAQYVMGKTFKRTSLYKMYYFIPTYYFTPHRMRIFNSDICIVIYGCAAPLSDNRETSLDLSLQLKALSDHNRLLILRMLSGNKEYGAKLAEYLGITTATVSHHLEILKKAGFVKQEKVGTIKYFSSNQEHTQSTFNEIQKFIFPGK
ncbi:ArsR/SmtB family transcription factor [Psychrobacillus sp. L3]|uniref:ArsR/SmtB family transcription factor n=1 Tax=Psychrobacillus sp. L3 TaxID=3236891 RepID=UPI0036F2BB3A